MPYTPSPSCANFSNTPKKPGSAGTATPIAISPCSMSAALNDTSMPTALNPSQKASAFMSHMTIDHAIADTNFTGSRSTASPDREREQNARARAPRSRGAILRATHSHTRIARSVKNTIR